MRLIRLFAYGLIVLVAARAQAGRPFEEPAVTPVSAVLSVIDPATGQEKVLFNAEHQSLGKPVVLGNLVLVASSEHVLYALDSHNGQVVWKFTAPAPVFGISVTDKTIFCGAGGTLSALEAATGKLLWKYENDLAIVDPVVFEGIIIFNAVDGPVALEQATGKLRWQLPVQWGYFVISPLSEHRLCVWKPDEIFVIDSEQGKTLWQSTPDQTTSAPGALPTAAVAADDTIFQLRGSASDSNNWSLVTLDAGSGRQLWKTPLGQHESAGARTTITGKCIYTQLDDQISAIDMAHGTIKWEATVEHLEAGGTPPLADHGLVLVCQLGGDITALDETSGKLKWLNSAAKLQGDGKIRTSGICGADAGIYVTRNNLHTKE